MVLVVFGFLVIGGGVWYFQQKELTEPNLETIFSQTDKSNENNPLYFKDESGDIYLQSASGSSLAHKGLSRSGGVWTGTKGSLVSPDGQRFSYILNDHVLYIQNSKREIITVTPEQLKPEISTFYQVYAHGWSPDSTKLLYHIIEDNLCFSMDGKNISPLCERPHTKIPDYAGFYVYDFDSNSSRRYQIGEAPQPGKTVYHYQKWLNDNSILFTTEDYVLYEFGPLTGQIAVSNILGSPGVKRGFAFHYIGKAGNGHIFTEGQGAGNSLTSAIIYYDGEKQNIIATSTWASIQSDNIYISSDGTFVEYIIEDKNNAPSPGKYSYEIATGKYFVK